MITSSRLTAFSASVLIVAGLMAGAAAAKTIEQELASCRALPSRDARTDCYDSLADRVARNAQAAPVSSAPVIAAPEQPVAAAAPSEPSVPQAPALGSPASAPPVAPSAAPSATVASAPAAPQQGETLRQGSSWTSIITGNVVDGVSVAITQVARNEEGRLRLLLADGTTWDQSEDYRIRAWPKTGDSVTVSKSAFGYWCRLNKRDLFHCKPRRKTD